MKVASVPGGGGIDVVVWVDQGGEDGEVGDVPDAAGVEGDGVGDGLRDEGAE